VIEYALIGASVLFVMWRHVERRWVSNAQVSRMHNNINTKKTKKNLRLV
jgi:hypothetical protein